MTSRVRILAAIMAACILVPISGYGSAGAARTHSSSHLDLITSGTLTIGTDATYPPMESVDPQTSQFVGADIDLGTALAKAMGLKVKWVNNSFDSIIPAMQRKRFDAIMASMNDTPDREKVISFVKYMRASIGILIRSDESVKANGYSGLCGHSVGVERGTVELDGLLAANKKCKGSKIDIHAFTKDTDAFQALASHQAEAYTGDLPVVLNYIKMHRGQYKMAGKAFGAGQDYGIGLLKSNGALKTALQKALNTIRKNGRYAKILKKWGIQGAKL